MASGKVAAVKFVPRPLAKSAIPFMMAEVEIQVRVGKFNASDSDSYITCHSMSQRASTGLHAAPQHAAVCSCCALQHTGTCRARSLLHHVKLANVEMLLNLSHSRLVPTSLLIGRSVLCYTYTSLG